MSTDVIVPAVPDTKAVTVISGETEEAISGIVSQALLLPSSLEKSADAIMCRSVMNQAGQLAKAIDAQRKKISDPYEKAKKTIIAAAKESLDTLEQVIEGCKTLLAGYVVATQVENLRAEEAREAMEADAPQGDRPTAALVLDAPPQQSLDVVPMTTVYDLEIIDETLIPPEYYVLDRVRLRKDVLAGVEVPGCRKRADKTIANR